MPFSNLPIELIVKALTLLELIDILHFCSTNRFYLEILKKSSLLQYLIELGICGSEDDASSSLHIRDRLLYLRQREENWRAMRMDKKIKVMVAHPASNIYDLSGGFFFLGDQMEGLNVITRTRNLRILELPKCMHGPLVREALWRPISPVGNIVDIGLSLQEHDLLAAITIEPYQGPIRIPIGYGINVVKLHLVQSSTGHHHPSSREPSYVVAAVPDIYNRPAITIEIVGPYLLLLMTWQHSPVPAALDQLRIYNWKTGAYSQIAEVKGTRSSLAFISADICVLPNMSDCTLDFMGIYTDTSGIPHLRPIQNLALPRLRPNCHIVHVGSRADPPLMGHTRESAKDTSSVPSADRSDTATRSHGIHASAEQAIVIFNLHVHSGASWSRFSFVIHRSELLRLAGIEWEKEYLDDNNCVQWEIWGPMATRWEETADFDSAYITTTAGQKQVSIEVEASSRITVRDYNPISVKRALAAIPGDTEHLRVSVGESWTPHRDYFEEDIRSSLPYVEAVSQDEYVYHGVLMDEDRIIGVKEDDGEGIIKQLDIFLMSPEEPSVCDCQA